MSFWAEDDEGRRFSLPIWFPTWPIPRNTKIRLINGAQAKNVLFATTDMFTTGAARSTVGGSWPEPPSHSVKGPREELCLATAAMTAGRIALNSESIGADEANSPIETAIAAAVPPPLSALAISLLLVHHIARLDAVIRAR
jgi:hypothetical protein